MGRVIIGLFNGSFEAIDGMQQPVARYSISNEKASVGFSYDTPSECVIESLYGVDVLVKESDSTYFSRFRCVLNMGDNELIRAYIRGDDEANFEVVNGVSSSGFDMAFDHPMMGVWKKCEILIEVIPPIVKPDNWIKFVNYEGGVLENIDITNSKSIIQDLNSEINIGFTEYEGYVDNFYLSPDEGFIVDKLRVVSTLNDVESVADYDQFKVIQFYNPNESDSLTKTCFINVVSDSPIVDNKEIGNIYSLNSNDFNRLLKETFTIFIGDDAIKYEQWISNLRKYPFNIESYYVDKVEPIRLGDRSFNTNASLLNNSIIKLDFGLVEIPKIFNNSLDFLNRYKIYFPLMESPIDLEIGSIYNGYIGLNLCVNISDGVSTINVTSEGETIISKSLIIGSVVPLKNLESFQGVLVSESGSLNNVKIPKLIVEYDDYVNVITEVEGVIGSFSGYVEVKKPMIDVNCLQIENDEIINLLENGVYINE